MKGKVVFCVVLFVLLFCAQLLITRPTHAQLTCTATALGWGQASSWSGCGGDIPSIDDDVLIPVNMVVNIAAANARSITVQNGGTLSVGNNNNARTLNIADTLVVDSGGVFQPFTGGSLPITHQVFIGGNLTNNGTFDGRIVGPGNVFEVEFNGTVTQTIGGSNLARFNSLTVNDTAVVVIPAGTTQPTVEGTLTNNGTLMQVRPVNNAAVPFLEILDFAGTTVKYRGVEVTSAADLGDVTVLVEKVNYSGDEFCTTAGDNSPVYADRCFTITPDTSDTAVIRLYALNPDELNSIAVAALAVYRHIPTVGWVELTTLQNTGTDGGAYAFAEGQTTGFSSFLLANTANSPTAVTLQTFTIANNTAWLLIISIIITTLALVTARVFLNRRAWQH